MRCAALVVVAACQAGPSTTTPMAGSPTATAPRDAAARDLKAVYGATPAIPGALFAGIELVSPGNDPRATPRAIEDYAAAHDVHITLALDAITIEVTGGCTELAGQLAAAWGAAPSNVWLDPATHHRARLHPDPKACKLRFDRYADVAMFIDQTLTAVVPLAVIGTPAKDLRSRLGPRLESDQDEGTADPRLRVNENALLGELSWRDAGVGPGVDDGRSPLTFITAYTKRGKVVGLEVSASVDHATGEAIRDRITALRKASPMDDLDEGMLVWKAEPSVHLDYECKRFAERTALDCFHIEVGTMRASFGH